MNNTQTIKNRSDQTIRKRSVSCLIKLETLALKGIKPFETTMKKQDGITKPFYEYLSQKAKNLRDKVMFAIAWETGTRVSELVSLRKANLEGSYLRYATTKHQFKCLSCGIYKRTHQNIGKKGKPTNPKSCDVYTPKVETFYKKIILSPQALTDLKTYMNTLSTENLFPYTEQGIGKIVRSYYPSLSIHDFRRGKGIWLMKNGANRQQLIAFLGHKGFQALEHYMGHQEDQLNEYLTRVHEGKDTRVFSDLPVYKVEEMIKEWLTKG